MLLVQYTLIYTIVLVLVALGGMFAERSGVINLGLEGIMVIGALVGSIVSSMLIKAGTDPTIILIVSILSSIVAGLLFSMLLGVACITFKADQTLVGTALNIMSTALAVVVARSYTKTPSSQIEYQSSIYKNPLEINSTIIIVFLAIVLIVCALIAGVSKYLEVKHNRKLFNLKSNKFFNIYTICLGVGVVDLILIVLTIIFPQENPFIVETSCFLPMALIAVIISYLYLFKTKFGMRLMACGEHPQAAASAGINVFTQRYIGVGVSGVLAGLGGFAYIVQSAGVWDFKYGVAGFGFLALAVMIFGQWKPVRILFAALIFGLCQTASVLYAGSFGIPQFVYKMLPYVVCMVVLVMTSKKSRAPKAEGQPYDKGKR